MQKRVAELIPFATFAVTVLLAVLGQAAWLDGKIERLDTRLGNEINRMEDRLDKKIDRLDKKIDRLDAKVDALQQGQAAIRERIAGVERRVDALENPDQAKPFDASQANAHPDRSRLGHGSGCWWCSPVVRFADGSIARPVHSFRL